MIYKPLFDKPYKGWFYQYQITHQIEKDIRDYLLKEICDLLRHGK